MLATAFVILQRTRKDIFDNAHRVLLKSPVYGRSPVGSAGEGLCRLPRRGDRWVFLAA
jgi:hypothetical protein